MAGLLLRRAAADPPAPQPIVIYDSGVGGLTVARLLAAARPGDNLLYVADNSWFPYGVKADLALCARIFALLQAFVEQASPRAIVVACNTASTAIAASLDDLNASVPIFTVTPPVRDAIRSTPDGRIALLATPATARRALARGMIEQDCPAGQIAVVPVMALVHLAERKLAGSPVTAAEVAAALDPLIGARERAEIEGVILGCTHFSWLREELASAFPSAWTWSDPASETARRVLRQTPAVTGACGGRDLLLTSRAGEERIRRVFARHGFGRPGARPAPAAPVCGGQTAAW